MNQKLKWIYNRMLYNSGIPSVRFEQKKIEKIFSILEIDNKSEIKPVNLLKFYFEFNKFLIDNIWCRTCFEIAEMNYEIIFNNGLKKIYDKLCEDYGDVAGLEQMLKIQESNDIYYVTHNFIMLKISSFSKDFDFYEYCESVFFDEF